MWDGGSSAQEGVWEEMAGNIRASIKSNITNPEDRRFQNGWSQMGEIQPVRVKIKNKLFI